MPRRSQRNVGVIGLGIIGTPVMDNLRRKGFHVFVWNRSPRIVPNFVGAPVEVAEMCDYVQIFVSDDDALLDVVQQISPALAPRHIVLAHPTVAPNSMRAAADIVERRGARCVEAPFTGSKIGAEKGELVYYVAGDEVALREARPVLEASAREIIEIDKIGQATAIKVATNIVTAATVQAAAEALALVQNSGVSLEKFIVAMQSNASNSGVLSLKLPKMIEGDLEPHFSIKHKLKHMQIATRLG
jgi:3-hydroxyisobutyrate dehydrogenase-like beta-hydroxyacid dehydrogenase